MKWLLVAVLLPLVSGFLRVTKSSAPDFDHLRLSVVRIQAVSADFDWFHPFVPGDDGVGLGSGFVVQTEPYPLFVTNAHVINDAKQVSLQLLLYGEQQWEAEVVSVCQKFDLAILVLKSPDEFKQAMKSRDITIESLHISDSVAAMGQDVVALGFPLGQDSLKISKGNIAGNEEVDGNICIQSTAPISPGSSGGPLLNADGSEVVGVNFAKATQGENINYVIPAWRVSQMVKKHLHDQPQQPADGLWKRLRVSVPKPELTTIESNEALYTMGGCKQGVYISKIGERSFFRTATPPVNNQTFLVSVRGINLDNFGMGINPKYAADRVEYPDLFFMAPELSSDLEFETCSGGKNTKHTVSLAYKSEYDRGITYVEEPYQSGLMKTYEMFGDISVMQMTVNHISAIVSEWGDPGPTRWLHPDLVAEPQLIVNYVRSGTYAGDILSVGAAVKRLNGHEVHTLEDFRQHLIPDSGDVWTLETDMGKVCALMFDQSLKEQVEMAQQMNAHYLLTPGVVTAAKSRGLMQEGSGSLSGTIMAVSQHELADAENELAKDDSEDPLFETEVEKASERMRRASDELRRAVKEKRSKFKPEKSASLLSKSKTLASSASISLGTGLAVRASGPLIATRPQPNAQRTTSSVRMLLNV